jgi:ATP-dependent DNA helicase RecG
MVPSYITIREALANLLMHRDYFDTGIAVVRVFRDKIIFRNPGASLLSMAEILTESETLPRNPFIAKAFRLVGWAESAGSGILKIQNNWQEAGFPLPVIKNNHPRYWFTLELLKEKPNDKVGIKVGNGVGIKVGINLTENQEKIIELLKNKAQITAKELALELGISQRKVEENLAKLKTMAFIKREGSRKAGHWLVIE